MNTTNGSKVGTHTVKSPIRELDNRPIGSGGRGPITKELQSKYFKIVHGEVENYTHWLTKAC